MLHLLYARFWHKVLFDLGHVSTPEPFFKLVNQGLILGEMEFYGFCENNPIGTPSDAWITREEIADIETSGSELIGVKKNTGEKIRAIRVAAELVEKDGPYFYLKN